MKIAGPGVMRALTLEDGDYLMFAEKEVSSLSIKKSKRSSKFVYHSYEDETDVRDLGGNY